MNLGANLDIKISEVGRAMLSERMALAIVLPFYRTLWFRGLCSVAVLTFLAGCAYWLRSSSAAARRFAEEQANERIKIAQELYDSLLQGLQGVLLSFHAAAQGVPHGHASRASLERALTSADKIILESRERINRLSLEHLKSSDLEPAIQVVADELSSLSTSRFTLQRTGQARALNKLIVDEIAFIAREAITNSYRHSRASQICVTLDYGREHFTLTCRDDGEGFDTFEFEESATRAHWGLRCVARRASRIGAIFDCRSNPGEGTEIRVVVPARQAYLRTLSLGLFSHRREI